MKASGVLIRELDGEVLALDTEADQIHQLNSTASIIWRMHAKSASEEEIARALARDFDVDRASAMKDVRETLAKFRDLGLDIA